MECQICCEKFNMSTRRKVNCNYCEYSPCRSCFQRYLTETTLDPHCMNCKKGFTYEFVSETCTSVFVNKALKKHRENVLFDREKALLPITQNDVLIEKERRKGPGRSRECKKQFLRNIYSNQQRQFSPCGHLVFL